MKHFNLSITGRSVPSGAGRDGHGLPRARDAGCRKVMQRRKIRAMGMLSDKNGKCKGLFDGRGNSLEPNAVQFDRYRPNEVTDCLQLKIFSEKPIKISVCGFEKVSGVKGRTRKPKNRPRRRRNVKLIRCGGVRIDRTLAWERDDGSGQGRQADTRRGSGR